MFLNKFRKTSFLSFLAILVTVNFQTKSNSENFAEFLGTKVSSKTVDYVNSIKKQLDPSLKINSIVNVNKFIKYLYGHQNAIAIPYFNYLLINEDWLKTLPEESQRFLIGYCLMQLMQKEHTFCTLLLPNIVYVLGSLFVGGEFTFASHILLSIFARQSLYDLDKSVVTKLNCAKGARLLFEDMSKFKHDGTTLGKICATIPLIDMFLPLSALKHNTPGKLTDRSNSVGNWLSNLPIIHNFWYYPKHESRVQNIEA